MFRQFPGLRWITVLFRLVGKLLSVPHNFGAAFATDHGRGEGRSEFSALRCCHPLSCFDVTGHFFQQWPDAVVTHIMKGTLEGEYIALSNFSERFGSLLPLEPVVVSQVVSAEIIRAPSSTLRQKLTVSSPLPSACHTLTHIHKKFTIGNIHFPMFRMPPNKSSLRRISSGLPDTQIMPPISPTQVSKGGNRKTRSEPVGMATFLPKILSLRSFSAISRVCPLF